MDEDFEADLVVVVVECQKRDSQTDTQTAQLYIQMKVRKALTIFHY